MTSDAHSPQEVAAMVERLGVAKARADGVSLFVLALLAGGFISLGAMLFTVIVTGSTLGFGVTRLVGGVGFSLGLILVVVGGAELFTGNNLLAMAWASGRITTRELVRSWSIVYAGNILGCLGTVLAVVAADTASLGDGAIRTTALQIAVAKTTLPAIDLFARGVLCNALVCMAVWLAMGGRSVGDKILAIVLPISAFVALGFEHSVANWFFLPYGMALDAAAVPLAGVARNLVAVTAGNIVGGTLLVGGVYWLAYHRRA